MGTKKSSSVQKDSISMSYEEFMGKVVDISKKHNLDTEDMKARFSSELFGVPLQRFNIRGKAMVEVGVNFTVYAKNAKEARAMALSKSTIDGGSDITDTELFDDAGEEVIENRMLDLKIEAIEGQDEDEEDEDLDDDEEDLEENSEVDLG